MAAERPDHGAPAEGRLTRLLRAPAVHFVVAGGLLFAAHTWWWGRDAPDAARPRIVITADDVGRLRNEWAEQHGAPPDTATERALVDDAVDEEVLHREALAAGFDHRDRFVAERLVNLGRFLGEATEGGAQAVEQEARRLGLAERDVVIRRHLVQLMRLALARLGPADMPDDSELATYLASHSALFAHAEQVRLTHVYLGRDRHGRALEGDAVQLLDELRRAGTQPDDAPSRGDPFLRGAHVDAASEDDLARTFGRAFVEAIRAAPVGQWVGPVPSSYGLHLVWIHERIPARVPSLDNVRAQVAHRMLDERAAGRLRDRLDSLRDHYEVDIER